MIAVQEICDRTALATGQSLGALARRRSTINARAVIAILLVALVGANCLNLSADLMAIGQGMQLVHAGPAPGWNARAAKNARARCKIPMLVVAFSSPRCSVQARRE